MAAREADKIITKAAKEILKPIGLFQVGSSRVWVEDNDWFFTVVEFQPSSWSQGAYLNVAVSFLWEDGKDFSEILPYNIGGRVHEHIEYTNNDDEFYKDMLTLSNTAKENVLKYRYIFSDKKKALSEIKKTLNKPSLVHHAWDLAMCLYFQENYDEGDKAMKKMLLHAEKEREFISCGKKYISDWVLEKEELAKTLLSLPDKKSYVVSSIVRKRKLLCQKPKYKKMKKEI